MAVIVIIVIRQNLFVTFGNFIDKYTLALLVYKGFGCKVKNILS